MSDVIVTYQMVCRDGRCEGFMCRCIAEQLAAGMAELTELRAVLAAMGAEKEIGGWTMPNPHRDWHAWTEEEGYTCDACGDGPHCVFGFQPYVPIPNLAPVAGGEHD